MNSARKFQCKSCGTTLLSFSGNPIEYCRRCRKTNRNAYTKHERAKRYSMVTEMFDKCEENYSMSFVIKDCRTNKIVLRVGHDKSGNLPLAKEALKDFIEKHCKESTNSIVE